MINKRIAISALSILTSLSLMAGATFAYFSNSATSTNNTFSAGSLDLKLDDDNETTPADNVSNSIQLSNLTPGVGQTGFISLHNPAVGSMNFAEVEFGATITGGDVVNSPEGNKLSEVLDLTVKTGSDNSCTTKQVDRTAAITTALGNGVAPLTLAELAASDYDALPGLNTGDTYYVCLTATINSTAGNEFQGDNLTAEFVFNANQDVSQ